MVIQNKLIKRNTFYIGVFFLLLYCACAVPPSHKAFYKVPIVRVGLVVGQSEQQFEPSGSFYIVTTEKSRKFEKSVAGNWTLSLIAGDSSGEINLISPSGESYIFQPPIRISGCQVTLKDMAVGTGYHWAHQEDRSYRGEIEIQIGRDKRMEVINVLPLETYLEGVLPGEMSSHFPLEALKAQAIAARTFFLYNFGKVHRNEHYDVCDDVHCQLYVGIGKDSEQIHDAIEKTAGRVLTYQDELCLTPYSAVCGGHTENAENVWDGNGRPYLQGRYDHPSLNKGGFDLSKEENAKRWIESPAKVFCNIELAGTPQFAAYSKNYFRWEKRILTTELEKNILLKTKRDIGRLLNIVPLQRGVSGRLIRVQICGSTDTLIVNKELNIRTLFSPDVLYSACFIIKKDIVAESGAEEYVFQGAGWGHGVGMCQIGAAMMALKGMSYKTILAHYYRGTKVKRLY